jgi:hypothetical protein
MLISIVSIVLSSAAFLFGVFAWCERKSQDQRDLFLKRTKFTAPLPSRTS